MTTDGSPPSGPFASETTTPDWAVRVRECTLAALDTGDTPPRRVMVPTRPVSAWLGVWLPGRDATPVDLPSTDSDDEETFTPLVVAIDHASIAWGEILPNLQGRRLRLVAFTADEVPGQPSGAQSGRTQISFDAVRYVTTARHGLRYRTFLCGCAPAEAAVHTRPDRDHADVG